MTKKAEEMTFEEAITELEKLVEKLENGNLDLEKSIEVYREAVELRKRCETILADSERKVEQLMKTAEGTVRGSFTP